jgi:hypothetical protein
MYHAIVLRMHRWLWGDDAPGWRHRILYDAALDIAPALAD